LFQSNQHNSICQDMRLIRLQQSENKTFLLNITKNLIVSKLPKGRMMTYPVAKFWKSITSALIPWSRRYPNLSYLSIVTCRQWEGKLWLVSKQANKILLIMLIPMNLALNSNSFYFMIFSVWPAIDFQQISWTKC